MPQDPPDAWNVSPWLGASAPAIFDLWRAGTLWSEHTGWFTPPANPESDKEAEELLRRA